MGVSSGSMAIYIYIIYIQYIYNISPLLPSSVPDLEFDRLSVQLNGADLEVHANCTDVGLCVGVVSKTKQEAGLTHTRVSNQEKLEQVVVFRRHAIRMEWQEVEFGVGVGEI